MRIMLAQINPTIGDLEGNTQKILQAIDHAKQKHAELVVFPELALSGYPPEDLLLLPHFVEQVEVQLEKIVARTKNLTVILGLPRKNPNEKEKALLNSAAIIQNQSILGYYDKILLPTYDVFDERRYFEPGKEVMLWTIHGYKIAVTICEDIWEESKLVSATSYLRDPVNEIKKLKPDLLVNLSASPYSLYKPSLRQAVCLRAATTLNRPVVLCNQVGGNDSLIFDGFSLCVNGQGKLENLAKGFHEENIFQEFPFPNHPIDYKPNETIEDLFHALVLGVRDYFHKSGFTQACLGLSGGIDSALVACIAAEALGNENVLAVLMPSRYSSVGSIDDSLKLVENLNIKHQTISIEQPFESYLKILEPSFEGKKTDVTEENLQARIRGMILMALSNKFGYIVLSTGNKSELAMGYSTLYGDMCGGLGVISDVTKTQVYALAEFINKKNSIIPQNIIDKPPSAELRPNQKDSDSLPDYAIIDAVLGDYVEKHLSPQEIVERHAFSLDLVNDLIEKIHRNEYKRRQAPPGLRVSERSFTVGRKFPIVQRWV